MRGRGCVEMMDLDAALLFLAGDGQKTAHLGARAPATWDRILRAPARSSLLVAPGCWRTAPEESHGGTDGGSPMAARSHRWRRGFAREGAVSRVGARKGAARRCGWGKFGVGFRIPYSLFIFPLFFLGNYDT